MQLGQDEELRVGYRGADRPRTLREKSDRLVGVAEDRRRLQRGDREGPQSNPPQPLVTLSKASVTTWPCSPPSTGSYVQFSV